MSYRGTLTNLEQPSFGEHIAKGVGGATQSWISGLQQQQKQQKTAELLSQMTGLDSDTLSKIDPQHYSDLLKYGGQKGLQELKNRGLYEETSQKKDDFKGALKRFGMSDEEASRIADLYSQLTEGGKTQYANTIVDKLLRGQGGLTDEAVETESFEGPNEEGFAIEEELESPNPKAAIESKFPKINPFENLTPKEKVGRQKEFYNDNKSIYGDVSEKSNSLKRETRSLEQLKRLNSSGKLPEGLGRINLDHKTGKLRLPAAANAQTQLYTKVVNDFITQAKDTFGARVTNFELDTFLQRLPTLANTTDGRQLILEQMGIVNSLNRLYNDSLKDVYDKYGLRGIDRQDAERIAQGLRQEEEDKLLAQYEKIPDMLDVQEDKAGAQEGEVLVEINGKRFYAPIEKLDELGQMGAKIL